MKAIAAKKPDILIADISLNGPDGLYLLKTARSSYPDLPVLVLSMHDESIYAARALRARVNGYIMKQQATDGKTALFSPQTIRVLPREEFTL